MKRVVKLNESDIARIVNKVITDNNQSINGSQLLIAVIITVLIVSLILFFTKKK